MWQIFENMFPKGFFLHYNVSSLGHFLVRSICVCQFACVSRAFRHTFTVGSPWVYGEFPLHLHGASAVLSLTHFLMRCPMLVFSLPFPVCSLLQTPSVFHAFRSALYHGCPVRSPKGFFPLSHASAVGSPTSFLVRYTVRSELLMRFPFVPAFFVSILFFRTNIHDT